MDWPDVETSIKAYLNAQWALTTYAATMPLVYENEEEDTDAAKFVQIDIQGNFSDAARYGSAGKRHVVDYGIVFFHAFVPRGEGKAVALGPVNAISRFLEFQILSSVIDFSGANPPTPVEQGTDQDYLVPNPQPSGIYYRCSGSVDFAVRSAR